MNFTLEELSSTFTYNPETGELFKAGKLLGENNAVSYIKARFKGHTIAAHRIAWMLMTGDLNPPMIDHKDQNLLNNKWSNLRATTHSRNAHNTRCRSNSGIKGVTKRPNGWQATFWHNGSNEYLGTFKSPELAQQAYEQRAATHYGTYASHL